MGESTDATVACAQLAVFICGTDENSEVTEELTALVTLIYTKKAGMQLCKIKGVTE
jgi:hypothetical protein